MKKLLVLVIFGATLLGWALPVGAQSGSSPAITSFATSVTQVDRGALANRTARVPVTWQAVNRPITANLVFDQVMPDGSTINVELPRSIPWVASSGYGVAAPILPDQAVNEIKLRLRLVNLITRHVYDEKTITIPIGTGSTTGGDTGGRPAITSFTTSTPTVRLADLQAGTARVPCAWTTVNRPVTANLVFEQVLTDGTVVNVELPRAVQWVASSGQGVMAPRVPGGDSTLLNLRVRLVDLVDGRVHDQRSLQVSIDTSTPPAPSIRYFYTTAPNVSAQALAARSARVPVSWFVDNRPDYSNLVFEQILPDNTTVNVELPRSNPWVASSGDGVAAPVLPAGTQTAIRLQVRLVDLRDNSTIDKREFSVPIVGTLPSGAPEVRSFNATPQQTTPGGLIYLAWEVRNAVRVGIREVFPSGQYGQWRDNLPATGQLALFTPTSGASVTYLLEAIGSSGETVTRQINVPLTPAPDTKTPVINSFTASPDPVEPGATLTLSWEVTNAVQVRIHRIGPQGALLPDAIGPASPTQFSGTMTYTVPADATQQLRFVLWATGSSPEGRSASKELTVGVSCPFPTTLVPGDCPVEQDSVQAAYQPFENGSMIWAGGSIYVLYNGGQWEQYADTWVEGETFNIGVQPPAGRVQPIRGFGKVWATLPQVRDRLGWALSLEQGYTATREAHSVPGAATPMTSLHITLPDGRVAHLENTWRIQ